MVTVRCVSAKSDDKCFTVGQHYVIEGADYVEDGFVIDDEGDDHELHVWCDDKYKAAIGGAIFVVVAGGVSDEHEEEEWQRIEKKCQGDSDDVCCDVAFAYQLSRIQKYLQDSGADLELVVHKDFIALNDEHCREFRGNVEQIMKYIKAAGDLAKVIDEMDRRN